MKSEQGNVPLQRRLQADMRTGPPDKPAPGRPDREAGGGLGGRAPCRGVLRVNERPAEGYKPEAELSMETATTIIPTANP